MFAAETITMKKLHLLLLFFMIATIAIIINQTNNNSNCIKTSTDNSLQKLEPENYSSFNMLAKYNFY